MWDSRCYQNPLSLIEWPQMAYHHHSDPSTSSSPAHQYLQLQYHVWSHAAYCWPFGISSSGDAPRRSSSASEKSLSCTVCADSAEGFHFGAVACAACGAFFRRSVSDQKVYACAHRRCNVRFDSAKRGGICRYCRFEKCLSVGMLPQEVQAKRVRKSESVSSAATASPRPLPLPRRKSTTGQLEALVQLRRDVAAARTRIYSGQSPRFGFSNWRRYLGVEWQLFVSHLLPSAAFSQMTREASIILEQPKEEPLEAPCSASCSSTSSANSSTALNTAPSSPLPDNWASLQPSRIRELFFLFVVFEMACATSIYGGVQMDRCAFYDGSHVELTDDSLRGFFAEDPANQDPDCLTRLSVEFFDLIVRVCSRNLQAAHLDEMETAYLFYATLAHGALRSQLDSTPATLHAEIGLYYETGGAEVWQKMGQLEQLLPPLLSSLHRFKELVVIVELLFGSWTSP